MTRSSIAGTLARRLSIVMLLVCFGPDAAPVMASVGLVAQEPRPGQPPAPPLPPPPPPPPEAPWGDTPRIQYVDLGVGLLTWNPITRRLEGIRLDDANTYATSLVVIDPVAGRIERAVPSGSVMHFLRSPDGQYAYVAVQGPGGTTIRRLRLPAGVVELDIPLGTDPQGAAYSLGDLAIMPAQPRSIAIVRRSGMGDVPEVVVYDDATPRPGVLRAGLAPAISTIVFGPGGTLLGIDVRESPSRIHRLGIDGGGVRLIDSTSFTEFFGGMTLVRDRIVTGSRLVIDAERLTAVGRVPFAGTNGTLMVPDADAGLVYTIDRDRDPWTPLAIRTLHAYRIDTLAEVWRISLRGILGSLSRGVRWGPSGLAFTMPSSVVGRGTLLLLQSPMIAHTALADLELSRSVGSSAGDTSTVTLSVLNRGDAAATGVTLSQVVSRDVVIVSATPSQGTCGTPFACELGELSAGASARVDVTLRAPSASFTHVARVSAREPDPSFANNAAGQVVMAEYWPLAPGTSLTYRNDDGGSFTTRVLPGPVVVNGVATTVLEDSDDGQQFHVTNDGDGLRLHRIFERQAVFGGVGDDLVLTFTPPVRLAPALVTLGQFTFTSGTATTNPRYLVGVQTVDVSTSFSVMAGPDARTPAGVFDIVRLAGSLRIGTSSQPWSLDLARSVGIVVERWHDGTRDRDTGLAAATLRPRALAVTRIAAPATVTIPPRRGSVTTRVTVQVRNVGGEVLVVPDRETLRSLVRLDVESLGTCAAPLPRAVPAGPLPRAIGPGQMLSVAFEITFTCSNVATAVPRRASRQPDYRYRARVDLRALDGTADAHPEDDACTNRSCRGGAPDVVTRIIRR